MKSELNIPKQKGKKTACQEEYNYSKYTCATG